MGSDSCCTVVEEMELFEQALVEKYLYLAFCDFSGEFKRARRIRIMVKSTAVRMETFKELVELACHSGYYRAVMDGYPELP
jgi:hypothetical protein